MDLLGAALPAGILLLGGGLATVFAIRHRRAWMGVGPARAMRQRQVRDRVARDAVALCAAMTRLEQGSNRSHRGPSPSPGHPQATGSGEGCSGTHAGISAGAVIVIVTGLRDLRAEVGVEDRRAVVRVMLAVVTQLQLAQARWVRWVAAALGVELASGSVRIAPSGSAR